MRRLSLSTSAFCGGIFVACLVGVALLTHPRAGNSVSAKADQSALRGRLAVVLMGRGRRRDLAIVHPRRRSVRRITRYRSLQVSYPEWSPDGRTIAVARGPAALNDHGGSVYVVGSTGRILRRIGHGWRPRWDRSGRTLLFSTHRGLASRPVRSPQRGGIAITGASEPSWSPDGTRLAFIRYQIRYVDKGVPIIASSSLFVVGRDGSRRRRVAMTGDCEPAYHAPEWAPNGSAITVTTEAADLDECPGSARPRVAVIDVATGQARQLPVETAALSEVRWSRDGQWLAYSSERAGVGILRPDGTGQRAFTRSRGRFVRWSPDSRWVAWIGEGRIVIASVAGSATVTIPAAVRPFIDDGKGLDWSPR